MLLHAFVNDVANTSESRDAPHFGAAVPPRQMDSTTLFDGAQEVRIDHNGQEYRLRQTRNGKLILTK